MSFDVAHVYPKMLERDDFDEIGRYNWELMAQNVDEWLTFMGDPANEFERRDAGLLYKYATYPAYFRDILHEAKSHEQKIDLEIMMSVHLTRSRSFFQHQSDDTRKSICAMLPRGQHTHVPWG